VNQTTGSVPGAGSGGGSSASAGGSISAGGGAAAGGGADPGTGRSTATPNGGRTRPRRIARGGTPLRRAGAVTPGRRPGITSLDARGPSRDRERANTDSAGSRSAPATAVRTIETVVKAVPTAIWIALGVLSLLAAGLAARTYVERRRARSLAADRAQLMGDVAALERALLPAVPDRLGGVNISVAYRSSEGPAAGGDFYDAFELPGGRAAVIVGDISGHGPDALEGTNSVRSQLHALLETGMTPRAAIALVGERSPVQLAGRFSTVVVAIHDPAEGTLVYATAGHPPPVLTGDGVEELMGVGASPPIGVELRTGLRETTVALPPGSTCCFYTDGIVEARNGDGMIGRERLTELVAGLDHGDQADVLLERVLAEAHDASDDMTVCVMRPVAAAAGRPPRIEVLELEGDDVDSGFAERFLEASGVPAAERSVAVDEAGAAIAAAGAAVLEVTVGDGPAAARVTAAPTRAAQAAAAEPA
jgi:serine phosphatase RsbU (regulator of sigma subunit)